MSSQAARASDDAKALAAAADEASSPEDAEKLADNADELSAKAAEELAAIRAVLLADEDPTAGPPPTIDDAPPGIQLRFLKVGQK